MFIEFKKCSFPSPTGLNINMMPIIAGDEDSIPLFAKQYAELINDVPLREGSTIYLTVNESLVEKGSTQRRPGVHTESIKLDSNIQWGGPQWGGHALHEGIYLASTDGLTRIWNHEVLPENVEK